jgi:tetratricopeptide (TPR) repeat protein
MIPMYLPKSSRWSMNRRRRRPNYFGWAIFGLVVLFGYYFNRVYLPSSPLLAGPTTTPTRSPEAYATEGEALFKEGKLAQAIDAYKAAINASPQDPTLYVALARTQVWAGKYEEAQSNAENALLLNPNNAMAHAVRAWALNFQPDKNGIAQEAIGEALKIDPNNAIIQSYYVEILIDAGFDKYDTGVEQSKIALALDPNIVETHRARGYLLARIPDPEPNPDPITNLEEAVQEYDAAIQINPKLSLLYLEQGQNYRNLSLKDKAIEAFTLANTLDPSDPQPDFFISRTYATYGEYEKALQYADTALQNKPEDATLRANLGVMYYRNFQYEEAVQELGLAIYGGTTKDGVEVNPIPLSNSPRVSEFYFTLGLALARTNQCGEALQIAQDLQSRGSEDDITADATNRIIEICQENLNNPPEETPTLNPLDLLTPSPEAETATPTVTPAAAP